MRQRTTFTSRCIPSKGYPEPHQKQHKKRRSSVYDQISFYKFVFLKRQDRMCKLFILFSPVHTPSSSLRTFTTLLILVVSPFSLFLLCRPSPLFSSNRFGLVVPSFRFSILLGSCISPSSRRSSCCPTSSSLRALLVGGVVMASSGLFC